MAMKLSDNVEKQRSLDLAEESRETEWKSISFVAEMFNGDFRWDLIHPFPTQDVDDKRLGDKFLEELEGCLREHIDPDEVDQTGNIPKSAIKALAKIGCLGMKIPKKYGGLELSQTNYNRAIALVGSYCASTAVFLSAHQKYRSTSAIKIIWYQRAEREIFTSARQRRNIGIRSYRSRCRIRSGKDDHFRHSR